MRALSALLLLAALGLLPNGLAAPLITSPTCRCEGYTTSSLPASAVEYIRIISASRPLSEADCSHVCSVVLKPAAETGEGGEPSPSPTTEATRTPPSTPASEPLPPDPLDQQVLPPPLYDPAAPRPRPLFDHPSSDSDRSFQIDLRPPPIPIVRTETLPPHTGAHVQPDNTPYPPSSSDDNGDDIGLANPALYRSRRCSWFKLLLRLGSVLVLLLLVLAAAVLLVVAGEGIVGWCLGRSRARSLSSGAMSREKQRARLWTEKVSGEAGRARRETRRWS
jgi:hypothetical protein